MAIRLSNMGCGCPPCGGGGIFCRVTPAYSGAAPFGCFDVLTGAQSAFFESPWHYGPPFADQSGPILAGGRVGVLVDNQDVWSVSPIPKAIVLRVWDVASAANVFTVTVHPYDASDLYPMALASDGVDWFCLVGHLMDQAVYLFKVSSVGVVSGPLATFSSTGSGEPPRSPSNGNMYLLCGSNDLLYVSGVFYDVNGTARPRLACLTKDGAVVTGFNAAVSYIDSEGGGVFPAGVPLNSGPYHMVEHAGHIYMTVAGYMDDVRRHSFGGTLRKGMAAVDLTTGALLTSFNPFPFASTVNGDGWKTYLPDSTDGSTRLHVVGLPNPLEDPPEGEEIIWYIYCERSARKSGVSYNNWCRILVSDGSISDIPRPSPWFSGAPNESEYAIAPSIALGLVVGLDKFFPTIVGPRRNMTAVSLAGEFTDLGWPIPFANVTAGGSGGSDKNWIEAAE